MSFECQLLGSQSSIMTDPYTFTMLDKGKHTFKATLQTGSNQSLTATDENDTSITGTETGITVK